MLMFGINDSYFHLIFKTLIMFLEPITELIKEMFNLQK